jgi:kynurenine formamidase
MKTVDLTHSMHKDMPVFPGTERPLFRSANTIENDGFLETFLSLYSHTGTHLDAPAHMIPGGKFLEDFDTDTFVGGGIVVDLRDRPSPPAGVEVFRQHRPAIEKAEFVLLLTGWSRFWNTEKYFRGFPSLSPAAAEYLADLSLKGVGIDAISIDDADSKVFPVHHILLRKNIVIIENLTNLEALAETDFLFSCLPLKYRRADGSPVRAAAFPRDRSAATD